ncbi:MAG: C69 family dipeptidase [Bacteroidaceae bacterium]|nr:C69 family dipeptidase [Bacteroidaceae bacterium]
MKRVFVVLGLVLACNAMAQTKAPEKDPFSCTSIMVGKKATVDGSVITSHTCDSWYRTWVNVVPAADYPNDTIMSIYDGRMHTEFATDQTGMIEKGTIPQAKHTYQFLDTSYPCLNEKQLGIGETTISGRRDLVNKKGMFMIEELERVALQRCTTAREAIKLMGELIKQYGYADSGECLTIADPQEVWHFEVFGEGPDKIGGVWAAVRIPDDEVGVSANIPRISTLNLKDPDHYMASDNVFDVAKKLGYWDGKETFKFYKAYGGPGRSGKYKAFSVREFFILSTLAPSLNLNMDSEELPFSVKPEKKLAATDVINYLKQTYEGTEFDNTKALMVEQTDRATGETKLVKSPAANPWMRSDEVAMLKAIATDKDAIQNNRLIAVPQCAYSTVIQLRSWLPNDIGGVVWFCMDNPGQSPRIPIFCGTTDLPVSFKICGNHRYRDDAALWHYRQANKLSTVRWGVARKDMEKNYDHFIQKGQTELPFVEQQYKLLVDKQGVDAARSYLTEYTADFAGATILRWDEMTRKFWNDNRFGF